MEKMVIQGGTPLKGTMTVHGAKNSALPILAAAVLCRGECVLHNVPSLTDIDAAIAILRYLGCRVRREGDTVRVYSESIHRWDIPEPLMREMRSSIVFMGSIAGRMGKVDLSTPGGCEIGLRPIDLHLKAMRQFGLKLEEEHGRLFCRNAAVLRGAKISLSFPSVGATENIMLAACTARGNTTLINAAREPEIVDLANFINECGGDIRGAGESVMEIYGVSALHGGEHTVIPDRILAATYLCAAAATHGNVVLEKVIPSHLGPVLPLFEQMGCRLAIDGQRIFLDAPPRLLPLETVRTQPYPGFPTDAQAPMMAVATLAQGTSMFVETIFESRFKHVSELIRLGAKIQVNDRVAVVSGVEGLSGAPVIAPDLRGGAALAVAGLAARGKTEITGLHHIDRGYESLERAFALVGGTIKREKVYEQNEQRETAKSKPAAEPEPSPGESGPKTA